MNFLRRATSQDFRTLDDMGLLNPQDRPLHSDGGTTDSGLRAEPLHRGPVFSTGGGA